MVILITIHLRTSVLKEGVVNIIKNRRKSKFKRIRIDPNIVVTKPKPMTISVIINNSLSQNYDEARFEWELKTILDEHSEGYSNICDLCGNPHLKYNFIITNPNTGIDLSVGSTCIIRFGIVKGNVDIESGSTIINNFIKDQESIFNVQSLVKGMMVLRPEANDFKLFYESLKRVLENRNIIEPTIDQLGEICFGDRWKEKKQDVFTRERLNLLWYKPLLVDTIKTKVSKLPKFEEGTTWGHKTRKSQVYLTAAGRTKDFKTDKISD